MKTISRVLAAAAVLACTGCFARFHEEGRGGRQGEYQPRDHEQGRDEHRGPEHGDDHHGDGRDRN